MESCKVNLFFMDRSYKQRLTLEFNEPNTEYKYFQETFLLRSSSFKSFQFWVFLILLYYCITTLRPSLSLLLLFSSFLSYFSPIHVKRFFFQVLFWIWKIECLTPNNLMESIGIFLPNIFLNFYLQGQWKWLFVTSTCEAFLLNFITDSSIFYLLLGVFTASTVSAALEKDFRDIWHLYSSSKKSKSMHKSLWENSLSVGFIVDLNLKIIKMNQLGKEICGNSFAPGDQIDSFIGEKKIVTRKLVENAIREENPEDLLIKHNIFTETNTKSTGTLVKSGKFNWNCRNYGILMCVDISTYLCKLKILQKSLKVLQLPTAKALNDFYQSFSKKSRSQSELFSSFNTSQHLFRCMGLLQNIFNAEFTPSAKHFNINAEILNLIELNYLLASKNALEIFYTKEKGIPDSVIGDKCLHNQIMQNILKTVLDNSVVNSEVHILLQVSVIFK